LNEQEKMEYIVTRGEELTLSYLEDVSNYPFIDGQTAFYDTETHYQHSKRNITRNPEHLLHNWVVNFTLDGKIMRCKVSNKKYVGGWNLEGLLWDGTREYTHPDKKGMTFYSRYAGKWFFKIHKRKGIPKKFVTAIHDLEIEAAKYGIGTAFQELRKM
jgi:hypothetical protein